MNGDEKIAVGAKIHLTFFESFSLDPKNTNLDQELYKEKLTLHE